MTTMMGLLMLLLGLAASTPLGAERAAPAPLAAGDFAALEVEWAKELEEWQLAVEAVRAAGGRRSEQPEHPALRYAPRFEAAAAAGEGRAALWLLEHLREATDGISARRALTGRIFEWVVAAGDAPWVAEALLALSDLRRDLDEERMTALVNSLAEEGRSPDVQAAALLVRARGLEGRDRAKAELIRFKLGRACDERGVAQELSPRLRDAVAQALVSDLERLRQEYFDQAYEHGEDGTWSLREDAPEDPRATYTPLLEALAEAGGARARVWLLANAHGSDEATVARNRVYLEELAQQGLSGPVLANLVRSTRTLTWSLGAEFVEPALRKLAENSPRGERPGVLLALGLALCETPDTAVDPSEPDAPGARERGLALLREVIAGWPDSPQARQAESKLFRYTHLVVGREAPELELEDVDGEAFKLSDFRGKVTVIDFWGFW